MNTSLKYSIVASALLFCASSAHTYVINSAWPDSDNIVMDDVMGEPCFGPSSFSDNAQFQMSEWNEVDTTDNSHPFRINLNPQCSFAGNDNDNTIGFLDETGLNNAYGLSFSNALAWTVCWSSGGWYDECDVIFDVNRPWRLGPDDNNWFQSTALHELGHVRGLGHYNNYLSMQNSGTSKYLRNETNYMDDKEGVRQNATAVAERDIVIYNKWHNGSAPRWMSMSPTTIRVGETIDLDNITVENRGTQAFNSELWFGIYLSTNDIISTGDTLLNRGFFNSFGRFTFSTFDWTAAIPSSVADCGTRWIGGIIDDENEWAERFEGNNAVVFTDGVPFVGETFTPTSLTILLAEDTFEQNDSTATATVIDLPFFNSRLNLDSDGENDYYRVNLQNPGTIEIEVLFSHSTGNINLQLLDVNGVVVESSSSTTDNESITRALTPGTYYVRVNGLGGGSCNKYTLDIAYVSNPVADVLVNGLDGPITIDEGQNLTVEIAFDAGDRVGDNSTYYIALDVPGHGVRFWLTQSGWVQQPNALPLFSGPMNSISRATLISFIPPAAKWDWYFFVTSASDVWFDVGQVDVIGPVNGGSSDARGPKGVEPLPEWSPTP